MAEACASRRAENTLGKPVCTRFECPAQPTGEAAGAAPEPPEPPLAPSTQVAGSSGLPFQDRTGGPGGPATQRLHAPCSARRA